MTQTPETIDQGLATSLAAAFHAAGYKTAAERLNEMMVAAIEEGGGLETPSLAAYERLLLADDDRWELWWDDTKEVKRMLYRRRFEAMLYHLRKARADLEKAAEPASEEGDHPGGGAARSPGRTKKAKKSSWVQPKKTTVRADLARQSALDRYIVNGRPIGDVTPDEVAAAAIKKEFDARFYNLLISGLPRGGVDVIRVYIDPDEADRREQMAYMLQH